MPLIIPANTISGGYEVANSLRFNSASSDNLSQTQSSGETKTFTYSCWFKKNRDLGSTDQDAMFTVGENNTNDFLLYFQQAEDIIDIIVRDSSTIRGRLTTNRKFRDYSAWMHIVFAYDSTNSTAGNRMRLYINGVEETSFATDTNPGLNQTTVVNNSSYTMRIGRLRSDARYLSGYLSECVLIDGTALDATSFGEFDSDTNIWKPIDVSGLTFGTNGFYLDFENSGSLGADVSGNGNNFTVNNLTAIDQSTDTCTNNFATLNALTKNTSRGTLSNGNLTYVATDTNWSAIPSTLGVSSGKWYAEFKFSSSTGGDLNIGVVDEASLYNVISSGTGASDFYMGKTTGSYGYFNNNGNKVNNASSVSYGDTWTNDDVVSVALNMDDGEITFYKNGVSQGVAYTGLSGTYFIGLSTYRTGNANFGSPPFSISSGNTDGNGYGNFEYAVPSGYYALNSKNLAEYG